MGDPREEMKHLAEQAIARQMRRRAAVQNGTIREHIRSEAKAARERYAEFIDDGADESEPSGEAGG